MRLILRIILLRRLKINNSAIENNRSMVIIFRFIYSYKIHSIETRYQ
jgi:hypothetical protein